MPTPISPYAALRVRTNPFSHELTIDGQPVRFDYLQGALAPQEHAWHLNYFFDLYNWVDHEQLGKLGRDGRILTFPDRVGRPGLIIVISGASGAGRTSLENLLRFEIASRAQSPPIVTEYRIGVTSKRAQDALNFASSFIKEVERRLINIGQKRKEVKNLPKQLRETVKEWKENLVADDPNTDFLFQQLAGDVRTYLPEPPIVFCLDASNHINTPDTWTPACTMLRNLADYIILSLSSQDHAAYLRTSLHDNQVRVLWIDVPRVNVDQTKQFLASRLAIQRNGMAAPGEELFPFTGEAVSAVFASTSGGQPVALSIGLAIKKLKGAFDKKCDDVAKLLADRGPAGVIPNSRFQITDEDIRRYFAG